MEWKLNDDRPIWLQLAEQMTRRIITGVYPPGSKLPPVRELAAEAGVNPNTMQRALAQLEQDGLAKADRTAGGWSPKTPLYWMRYGGRRPCGRQPILSRHGRAGLLPARGHGDAEGGGTMNEKLIVCHGLSKAYGHKAALSGVDLEVGQGRIVGLLGPNGSGKTTLIKLLCGLIQPTTGGLTIDGQAPGPETKAHG